MKKIKERAEWLFVWSWAIFNSCVSSSCWVLFLFFAAKWWLPAR